MQPSELARAVTATRAIAASLGLVVDDVGVLSNSNKVMLRLQVGEGADLVARVAPASYVDGLSFEVDLVKELGAVGSPVADLDPRVAPTVHRGDGFVASLWTYYPPTVPADVGWADYATALERLHAGMRTVSVAAPHFTDRVESAQLLVADRDLTPDLGDAERRLLSTTLRDLRAAITARGRPEQLLHGEPHPGNLLATDGEPVFVDFETCCRGPVEFDLAHAPDEVAKHYPGLDHDLLRECRLLKLAMIIMWRWDTDDQLPDGRRLAAAWTSELRAGLSSTSG